MSQVEFDNKDDDLEKGKKDDDEEQLIIVEDDPKAVDQDKDEEDEEEGEEGSEEKKEESRLGGGRDDDEDIEAKKARRREERKGRNQRQKEARERNDRELNFLRGRNETLERRFSTLEQTIDERITGSEIGNLDSAISKAKADLQLANSVMQQSIENKEGADLVEAMGHRDTIRDNLRDLEQTKEYLSQDNRTPRGGGARPKDPRLVAHVQSFMINHDWWDPQGRNPDDLTVRRLDDQLAKEGYDPTRKDYWDELGDRVKTELPHHFKDERDETDDNKGDDSETKGNTKRRSKGPTFRTGGRDRPLKSNEVFISAERKEAMIEAGVWDDPKLRNKFLKSYATYDKEAQREGA